MIPILIELWPTAPLRRLRAAVDAGDMRAAAEQLDELRRQARLQLVVALLISAVLIIAGWGLIH